MSLEDTRGWGVGVIINGPEYRGILRGEIAGGNYSNFKNLKRLL